MLADDVVQFLDALGLDKVHYIGESVGGITGIALGARSPERFHSITLVQTPIRLGPLLQDAMRGDYPTWSDALRALGPGGWVTRSMPAGAPKTEWERAQWDRCDAEALARLADATVHVDVEDSGGPGVTGVELRVGDDTVRISRSDGRTATLSRTGQPDRAMPPGNGSRTPGNCRIAATAASAAASTAPRSAPSKMRFPPATPLTVPNASSHVNSPSITGMRQKRRPASRLLIWKPSPK